MSVKSVRGKAGEDHVCDHLQNNGWTILERNFRIRGGEIDIIAKKGSVLAFVEVKSRKFGSLDDPLEAIDRRKQELLIRAADTYLERNPSDADTIRFDAAAVTLTTEAVPRVLEMKYYEDAFGAF